MRIGLIADVHSNILALEAVLSEMKRHAPDRIISLGDQINLGPCPKETLALLNAENVTCLHGNHERYVLAAMDNDPNYAGTNFASLRYNASLLTKEEITFPWTLEIEGVTFCHAMPDNDRFPVFETREAMPLLRGMRFDTPTHIICGHGHNPTHYSMGNLSIDSIGSAGCMDDGVPGTTPYAILDIEHGETGLRPYYTSYDTGPMRERFLKSGMAEYCPIMAHIICLQMMHNKDYLLRFVRQASALADERGEQTISTQTWSDVDNAFPWPDGISTAEFWRKR